jgi:RNA polymerase sigma factor (sigma-70 family)
VRRFGGLAQKVTLRPVEAESPNEDHAWSQLMRAAQGGDARAYERLLREVTPVVRAVARRVCSERHEIEEVVQETLLTLHRVRHTYDPARPFMPWLTAIASRRSIDELRRRRRIARHELSTEQAGWPTARASSADGRPGDGAPTDETSAGVAANKEVEGVRATEELGAMLRRLPARQREALVAVKLKELSLAEASAASGQSVGALKVNVHRALKTLRRLFHGDG